MYKFGDAGRKEDAREVPAEGEAQAGLLPPALLQYWQIALRRKWIILGIIATCMVVGIIATLLVSPKYTANIQLEIDRQQKQITNVEGLESEQAGRDLEFYATQYALLKARPLAERVAKDLRLSKSSEFFAAHGLERTFNDPEFQDKPAELDKIVVTTLLRNAAVNPVRISRLVGVAYTSRSPEMSTRIANAWGQAFIALNMDRQFASTLDARRFLEGRLAALRERLEQSERQMVEYASRQGIVTLEQTRNTEGKTSATRTLVSANLEMLNEALNRAVEARVLAQSRTGSDGEVASETIANPAIAALREQRSQAAAELARLLVQFEPGYPAAAEMQEKVRSIDAAIAREVQRIKGGRQLEYKEAGAREAELQQKVSALRGELDAQQRANIQYAIYQREADTNRELYDALLQRYKEIGVAGAVGSNNIAIVEPAIVPAKPSSPVLWLNVGIALMVGVVLAGAVALGLEQIEEGIRDPNQVPVQLGLPLLGHTPRTDRSLNEELRDTKSHMYEAYFSVRSNLSFTTSHGFPRSLLVTSTRPAEGKSSTAMALAIILGRTEKKVLLIDADMRSPSIHELTGVANTAGLSNILTGEDDWRSLIQGTDDKGVSILPAGPVPPSAAELLVGDRLAQFLADCAKDFDHVIIDAPPVLGLADAPLLSRFVEGCVFVVEAEGIAVRGVTAALARLRMVNAHVLGVLLTKLPLRHGQGYGYGYGYGYGRRYGEAS